jgi:hypothetical protein
MTDDDNDFSIRLEKVRGPRGLAMVKHGNAVAPYTLNVSGEGMWFLDTRDCNQYLTDVVCSTGLNRPALVPEQCIMDARTLGLVTKETS